MPTLIGRRSPLNMNTRNAATAARKTRPANKSAAPRPAGGAATVVVREPNRLKASITASLTNCSNPNSEPTTSANLNGQTGIL